jgi:NAD(P)-dependent dehydrogenase (short-subunit alcohol dehydrogenase family)
MRDDWGEEAATVLRRETETKAAYVKTDLRQRTDIEAMVAGVIHEFGRIDVLASVAAICPSEPIEDLKEETFERVFRINFLGTAFCCQAVLKQMRSQKSGHIVIIASGGAITPYAGLALYGAAKAAVIQFSKVLAFEEAKNGIVVTIVVRASFLQGRFWAARRTSARQTTILRLIATSYISEGSIFDAQRVGVAEREDTVTNSAHGRGNCCGYRPCENAC